MKQGVYFSAVALATLVATTFPVASHADSLVSVRADGSVARVEALPSNGATAFSAPTSKHTSVATSAQTKSSALQAPEMDWEEVEASMMLGKMPPGEADFEMAAGAESQADEESLQLVRRDLEKYPSGQVRVEDGKTFWVDLNGESILLSDNNRIAVSSRPGSHFVGRRHRRYFSPFYLVRFFSRYSPGYVFYWGRPGYLYRVPLGHYIGGYPVYGYPAYGYPGYGYPGYGYPDYGYPGYGYPAYDYPGYYSRSTTFRGPGSLTQTYREKTTGGVGVSVGRRGVGINLRSGSTTTGRSTITATMAPGSTITTSTYSPYPYKRAAICLQAEITTAAIHQRILERRAFRPISRHRPVR
jgi:hypothetical protein